MIRVYDFDSHLAFSKGVRATTDLEVIRTIIDGCVDVRTANAVEDRAGTDYIATLRRGAQIFIDAKSRTPGCSRFWRVDFDGQKIPELALEKWSCRPGGKYRTPWEQRKTGWTLCEAKGVDYILFTWNSEDTTDVYLMPFQLLRMAFRRHIREWYDLYRVDVQSSSRCGTAWESECVFVPAPVVEHAVSAVALSKI